MSNDRLLVESNSYTKANNSAANSPDSNAISQYSQPRTTILVG
jgi:hypothetical protein